MIWSASIKGRSLLQPGRTMVNQLVRPLTLDSTILYKENGDIQAVVNYTHWGQDSLTGIIMTGINNYTLILPSHNICIVSN